MRLIVSNTGPLLHLAEAHLEHLLPLSGDLHIPPAVAAEATRHHPAWGGALPAWLGLARLQSHGAAQAQAWEQAGLLHRGEAEALALALQLRADWFLTDDTAARVLGNSLGLEVHGSLGVVLSAAAAGYLNHVEAENALTQLAASTLWLSPRVLQEARDALEQILPPVIT